MGLTIYYRGTLRTSTNLELLLEDVVDICHEIGWTYTPLHRSEVMPVRGMLISPPGSEPIWLTFLENGRLYNPAHFMFTKNPKLEVVAENEHKLIFTKTRYAGAETHMAIIKFLRYLKLKYFEDFELTDESDYWATNDRTACLKQFGEYVGDRDKLDARLREFEDEFDDDDDESVADRMDEALLRRGGIGMSMN